MKDGVWRSGVKDGVSKMVCEGKVVCKMVCQRLCVTKWRVKDHVSKMVCDKVVCVKGSVCESCV